MKVVFVVCVVAAVCFFTDGVSAATAIGFNATCKAGDVWTDESCMQHICMKDGMVELASCGMAVCDDVAATKMDMSKPYPECCPSC